MMISPRQFIDWYRKADLELIVGVGDQEIRSNTDLWKGLKVYIHQYELKPGEKNNYYWNIERNRFNPKNELFQIRKKLFKNHYELLQSVILQKEMDATSVNDIKLQKYAIDQMAIKLNGLVDYMNSVTFIRKKVIDAIKLGELSETCDEVARANSLRHLLLAIDDPSVLELPVPIAPAYVTECYKKVMIGRNI